MSHSLTSPERQADTSSRWPPRCRCTFVSHALCSFHTRTMAVCGFSRWSYTRSAPSPKPATNRWPSTWSDVSDVIGLPERALMSAVQISVPAFHTRILLTSPATSISPLDCCQSKTRPAALLLGSRSVSARNAVTSSTDPGVS